MTKHISKVLRLIQIKIVFNNLKLYFYQKKEALILHKNHVMKEARRKNISEVIRTIREEKQLTQLYMAKKLRVTQQAYSNMENNPENVTLKRLRDIADLLGVELITLLGIDTGLVQQNFNPKGGNAATQMVNNYIASEQNDLYERLIAQLKEEIAHLRSVKK